MDARHAVMCCAVALVAFMGFHGCTRQELPEWSPATERERRLAQRINQFYTCGQQHDHEAMYDMFASALKGHANKKEWLSVFAEEEDPGDGVISFFIVSVEVSDTAEPAAYLGEPIATVERVALVEMKIIRRRRGRETSDTVLDTWTWQDEDWFFGGTD